MSDSILFLGATGFVGGDVLYKLLTSSNDIESIVIPASSSSKQTKVQKWIDGLNTKVKISIPIIAREPAENWYSECERLSSQVDCTIQLATSDDMKLTQAVNEGLIKGRKQNGKKGVLIHASGVQLIESKPVGEYVETPNYDDLDTKSIASIPDSAAHRSIDMEIENQLHSGALCGAIVCPALVWGKGKGPDKIVSIMIPDSVKKSLHNGQATYTGKGTNAWVHINIDDCSDLIILLIEKHLSKPFAVKEPALFSNFYFIAHSDLVTFKHITQVMGKALLERGKVSSAEPISVPVPSFDENMKGVRIEDDSRSKEDAEIDAKTPLWPCRTNCRCQAKRGLQEFGWSPKKVFDDEAIRQDVFIALDNM